MSKNLTYEEAINRLDEIVSLLEKNEVSLDEALKLFEEGTKLAAFCSKMLSDAKQKITTIEKD